MCQAVYNHIEKPQQNGVQQNEKNISTQYAYLKVFTIYSIHRHIPVVISLRRRHIFRCRFPNHEWINQMLSGHIMSLLAYAILVQSPVLSYIRKLHWNGNVILTVFIGCARNVIRCNERGHFYYKDYIVSWISIWTRVSVRVMFIAWSVIVNSLRPSDAYMRNKLTIIGSDNGLSPGACPT